MERQIRNTRKTLNMRDFGQEQGRSKVLAENQEMANESSHFL
jgi:hypothetical protein